MSTSFLTACARRRPERLPIWLMRQAGRYLPEYRELRARAGDFLNFCYSPALAAEATLQPLRRFDLDAAILFADILLVPHALGARLRFAEGEGPLIEPVQSAAAFVTPLSTVLDRLSPVFETVRRVATALKSETPLIGFCGGPWTVATYLIEGRGGTDKSAAKRFAYERPEEMSALLALLAEVSAHYLAEQVKAGADAVKIFESWAEGLSPVLFDRVVIEPTRTLIDRLRALGVHAPVIGFPRGAGVKIGEYQSKTGIDVLALDHETDPRVVGELIPAQMPVQGNIDPLALRIGGETLEAAVRDCVAGFRDRPHILNLGHGITPDVAPENVARLIAAARASA